MSPPGPRAFSIKTQLMLAVVLATVVASTVTAGLSLWREIGAYAEAKRIEARALAGLFASVSADAVADGDADAAHQVLGAMRHLPQVLHVRLAESSGATLAEHGLASRLERRGQATDAAPSFRELASGHPLAVSETIVRGGLPVGSVELLVATDDLQRRLAGLAVDGVAAAAFALVLGFLAAQGFRRKIGRRIESVTTAMRDVGSTHGYDTMLPAGVRDELGPLVDSFNSMMREIGARDRMLAEHRANLEAEVVARTSDLVMAKEAADNANAAKSRFLATMSHEIRTPLNGLMVMAELLAAAELGSREKRYADVIVRSGGTLLAIINDILDFSKIEAGRIELESIPFDLADMVDDVCQLFASKAAAQGLDLAAYVDPALAGFTGDPVRIGQVLGNLVNNAIKFTASGHVLVEATADPARAWHVLVSVTDTGIGIAADKLDGVFDSFSQADQSITRRYGGTGLGLSISQRLVGVMGGAIGVESRLGEGSRFWFSLPLAPHGEPDAFAVPAFAARGAGSATLAALSLYARQAQGGPGVVILDPRAEGEIATAGERVVALARMGDSLAENWIAQGRAAAALSWPVRRRELVAALQDAVHGRTERQAERLAPQAGATYPRARVLVADDSPVNREVATEALRRFGIAPDTACDGEEARQLAEAADYDLILMDGSMPVLDGFAASRAIRAEEAQRGRRRKPIVALTAHSLGDAAAWREAGMDGLLLKPFTLAQLAACLAGHLTPVGDAPAPEQGMTPNGRPPVRGGAEGPLLEAGTMETLALLASADAGAVRRIVQIFINEAGPAVRRLREAAADEAGADLAAAAHAFKSMAFSVGAKALGVMLGEIERLGRRERKAGRAIDFEALEALLARSIAALEEQPWMRESRAEAA
jgi:two-component system sensor histidine kinase BarA